MSGDPNFMTSLARGLAVIRGFTQQKRSLTISQLSQRTGIPRAAVRRCLYTLSRLGLVGSEDGKTFALRPKILGLGYAYLSSTTLATSAQPLLDRISDVLHESSSIALLDGDEILYVARSSTTRRIMSVDLGIGTRLPAYCTSMGRVLLAYLASAERDAYFARVKLVAHAARRRSRLRCCARSSTPSFAPATRSWIRNSSSACARSRLPGPGSGGQGRGGDEHQHPGVARVARRARAPVPARAIVGRARTGCGIALVR